MAKTATAVWSPVVSLDLDTATKTMFEDTLQKYRAWVKENPVEGPLPFETEWQNITPQMAEDYLRRNAGNRKVSFGTVKYYAAIMKRDEWKKTGQPVIFSSDGRLLDAQHRLWAGYLTGKTFPSLVVSDASDDPELFAYIDNIKARTPADALGTAGVNGIRSVLTDVLRIDHAYMHGPWTVKNINPPRWSPIQYLRAAQENADMAVACKQAADKYEEVAELFGGGKARRVVVAFLAHKINSLYSEAITESFFEEVASEEDLVGGTTNAAIALRKLCIETNEKGEPMSKAELIGHAIRAFNAWIQKVSLKKRWGILTTEVNLDRFEADAEELAEAAE